MEKVFNYYIDPLERLGEGAFGYVEKINLYNSNYDLCGSYCRKVLSPTQDILRSLTIEEVKRRFVREAIYQSKCVHDNVVYIYIFDRNAEKPYFVMDVADNDLQQDIDNNGLSEIDKIEVLKMMLYGLERIHGTGYLHRDIKPKNVLRFSSGIYKISDFGLVKDNGGNSDTTILTAIGQIMGTVKYMAPEVLYNAEYSLSSDIYAVGKVVEDLKINSSKYSSLLEKCVAMERKNRYTTVQDVISDFSRIKH